MGDAHGQGFIEDHEAPPVMKKVLAFEIADTTVTNREFKAFIDATGYTTTAETIGDSYVFHLLVGPEKRGEYAHVSGSPWWLLVPGASWNHPTGPESSIDDVMDHPVVHVSLQDALAYCDWAKVKLPTETQWEYAARGGTTTQFPWGNDLEEDASQPINFEYEYAIRGGSFLCHCSYCNRYRVAARNGALWDSTSSHLGFRCVRNVGGR